jgi:Type II secretion system (T2SS), protein N
LKPVKRSSVVFMCVAGLLVFLGILVFYLPASWFAGALPANAKCSELGGSIWHGECLGLAVEGNPIGDATWNFASGKAFTGRASGDVDVRGNALQARADLDIGLKGAGELRNFSARFPLDPAFIPKFPRNQRGNVVAEFKRVVLSDGPALASLQGTLELRDFRQVGSNPLELGSYQLTFDGAPATNGNVVGQLRDLGGPFMVSGTVTLSPPSAYLVEGFITGRTANAEKLVREITLGAPPDSSGRSAFSFEGSL